MDEYPGSQTLADRACEFFPVDLTLEFWLDACLLFVGDPEHLKMNLTKLFKNFLFPWPICYFLRKC